MCFSLSECHDLGHILAYFLLHFPIHHIVVTYFWVINPAPIKRECALRSSRIKNSWHMMKNKFFSIFRPKIPYGELRNVVGFFLQIFLLTPPKKIKTVNAPGFWKNTQN